MKVNSIILNQGIRLYTAALAEPEIDPAAVIHFLKALEARYAFLQGPRVVADYNPGAGITFLHGHYNRSVIDKLVIHTNGVVCEAKIPTEDIDLFLDEAIAWGREELKRPPILTDNERSRSYLSQVEIESDVNLGVTFSRFNDLGSRIADVVKSYGQNTSNFEISSIKLHCDIISLEVPKPGVAFTFERRDTTPYGKTYFAAAPLRTVDHYQFIEELETLLAAQL